MRTKGEEEKKERAKSREGGRTAHTYRPLAGNRIYVGGRFLGTHQLPAKKANIAPQVQRPKTPFMNDVEVREEHFKTVYSTTKESFKRQELFTRNAPNIMRYKITPAWCGNLTLSGSLTIW